MSLADRIAPSERAAPVWEPRTPASADADAVARVHAAVGEALTQRHATDEESGRPRLVGADERALSRKLIADELERLAREAFSAGRQALTPDEEQAVMDAVIDRLHGLAGIQPLLDDPEVRDIHISGASRVWLTLRDGRKVRGPSVAASDHALVELVATAARRVGRSERRWDNAHPELNLQLPNGDRLHALMAVTGRPTITIRRHDFRLHRLTQLRDLGVLDDSITRFVSAAVRAKLNVIVAGGTGTGKPPFCVASSTRSPPMSGSSRSRTPSRLGSSSSKSSIPITRRSRLAMPTPRAWVRTPSPTACELRFAWTRIA